MDIEEVMRDKVSTVWYRVFHLVMVLQNLGLYRFMFVRYDGI